MPNGLICCLRNSVCLTGEKEKGFLYQTGAENYENLQLADQKKGRICAY